MATLYQLEPRTLSAEDEPWLERFAVGEHWWDHEITKYVRHQALEDAAQGLSATTLFSFPGLKDIVGFFTAANGSVPVNQLGNLLSVSAAFTGTRVPAVIIPYLGVARQYQRVGHFGQEIHFRLLELLDSQDWAAVRLIYLECWEENHGGLAFWQKMGYERFNRMTKPHPETGASEYIWRLVYDRFAIRPSS